MNYYQKSEKFFNLDLCDFSIKPGTNDLGNLVCVNLEQYFQIQQEQRIFVHSIFATQAASISAQGEGEVYLNWKLEFVEVRSSSLSVLLSSGSNLFALADQLQDACDIDIGGAYLPDIVVQFNFIDFSEVYINIKLDTIFSAVNFVLDANFKNLSDDENGIINIILIIVTRYLESGGKFSFENFRLSSFLLVSNNNSCGNSKLFHGFVNYFSNGFVGRKNHLTDCIHMNYFYISYVDSRRGTNLNKSVIGKFIVNYSFNYLFGTEEFCFILLDIVDDDFQVRFLEEVFGSDVVKRIKKIFEIRVYFIEDNYILNLSLITTIRMSTENMLTGKVLSKFFWDERFGIVQLSLMRDFTSFEDFQVGGVLGK
jgi:hypothetical protein